MIKEVPKLMDLWDLLAAIGIAGLFSFFMIPTMVIVIIWAISYRRKRKNKQREIDKKQSIEDKEIITEIVNTYKAKTFTEEDIGEIIPIDEIDISRFKKLDLSFNEDGVAKSD